MIEVVSYDPKWPEQFDALRNEIAPVVGEAVIAIEHVGSTAVPGLWAKPIIDIDVIVHPADVPVAIEKLATIGYQHRGNLGIPGREAFDRATPIRHNLYVCVRDCLALRNHLAVRDYLRTHPACAAEYSALKRRLAEEVHGTNSYVAGKTDFLCGLLRAAGFSDVDNERIRSSNR